MKMSNLRIPNLKPEYLQTKIQEWQALECILTIDDPVSRWELFQIWLADKGDWQTVIKKVLQTPDNDDCFNVVLDALNIPRSLLAMFDANGKIRAGASHYIGVIKELYLARIAPPKVLN